MNRVDPAHLFRLFDRLDLEVDRGELLVELLVDLDARLGDLDAVARDYRRDCATLGRRVRVEVAGGTFEGEAIDLSREGHLVVRLADGADRVVSAGDVIHLR